MAVHGGISPELLKLEQINKINRQTEIPLEGLLCDLLWSDPMDETEGVKGEFKDNELRECAHFFGRKPLKKLIKNNPGLLSVFRAHQVKENGYEMHKFGKSNAFPTCITVFSAPNYCGSYGNRGAIIILKENNLKL